MKKYGLISLLVFAAFLAGKYVFPPKPEIKETIKTVVVEKIVEKRNVVKNTTVTEKPDGTKVTETTERDRSVIVDNTRSQTERKLEVKGAKYTLGVLAIKNVEKFSDKLQYGVTFTAPLIGNLKIQALGTTDKRVGLGLALDF